MILPIYIYGQPVLRKVAEDVELNKEELEPLIADMFATLEVSEGVGLAAPQIGKAIRVVVVDLSMLAEDLPEYKDFRHAYINGHIVDASEETETMSEGCLSLPGISEEVTRPKRVRIQYYDEELQLRDEWVDGFLARVLQHEHDHLEGHVFTDRISPFRRSMIKSKLTAFLKGKARCHYKVKTVKS
ncbi:MAG: peptide deformylase [Bacteroidaceae bacterium]|nr:peptide deformylase [Bacteroidaceae bacterium]